MNANRPVKMGSRDTFAEFNSAEMTGDSCDRAELARINPANPEADRTYDRLTNESIYRGFCGRLTCGKRAWQFSYHGRAETGRLCDSCFRDATANR